MYCREPFDGLAWSSLDGLFWIHSNRKACIDVMHWNSFIYFCILFVILFTSDICGIYPSSIRSWMKPKLHVLFWIDCLPVYELPSFMCLFCVCMCVHAYLCDLCLDSLNLFLWIPMKNDLKNKSSGQKSIDE